MILGLGIDHCEVPRMRRHIENDQDGFIESVFLPAEISYCSEKHRPAEHFAARFAAKEAVVKALADAGGEGSFWHDVEVVRETDGRPRLELNGRLKELADALGVRKLHVSLTHISEVAAAVVIAED